MTDLLTRYDPDRSDVRWDEREIDAARVRVAPTVLPAPGSRVLYRHDHHGDVTDALVMSVGAANDPTDANLWIEMGEARFPSPDPWVPLLLETLYGPVVTREARVRGSAGWLPQNWGG